jgi:hypothetical protein
MRFYICYYVLLAFIMGGMVYVQAEYTDEGITAHSALMLFAMAVGGFLFLTWVAYRKKAKYEAKLAWLRSKTREELEREYRSDMAGGVGLGILGTAVAFLLNPVGALFVGSRQADRLIARRAAHEENMALKNRLDQQDKS